MLWCCLAVQYCQGSFAVPGTDWCGVDLSTTALTPTHLNSSGQAVRLPFDQWLCSSILSREDRGTETDIGTQHTVFIYIPSMPALFFIRSEDTVVDGTTDKNSHCLPLVITQLFSHTLHGWGPLESGVCSPWPDKSSIERGVMSVAEMASASGKRATMEDGKWMRALQKAKVGIHRMKGWFNGTQFKTVS